MPGSNTVFFLSDMGGRRTGFHRRQFAYAYHIPERRDDPDRRAGQDPRMGEDRRGDGDRRNLLDLNIHLGLRSGVDRRRFTERRMAFA